jgi:putative ABC transport system permease protein
MRRLRLALVVGEVALATVLVVGAALLLKSFDRLLRVNPGFATDHVLTTRVTLPRVKYGDEAGRLGFAERLLAGALSQPGVRSAAVVSDAPLGDSPPYLSFEILGGEAPRDGSVQDAAVFWTSPQYFETLRIPLVDGRFYDATDRIGGDPVVVVNQTLARRFWSGRSALGARITLDDPADPEARWMSVVGIAGDIRHDRLADQAYPQIYLPFTQTPTRSMVLAARVEGDPAALVPAIRRSLAAIDPDLALTDIGSLEERKAASLARPRVNAAVLGAFALSALVLAAVGIYGVVAYGVVQRTRELGIRMALGAGGGSLLRMVIRQGMMPVLGGVALGLAGAVAGGRVLRSLLFGVGPGDPATLVAGVLIVALVTFAGSLAPALRAVRVSPLVAMRAD